MVSQVLDWLADVGIRLQVRLVLVVLIFVPPLVILIGLESGMQDAVASSLVMYMAVWVLLIIPVAKGLESIMALRNITLCNRFCRRLQEGKGLSDLHLPPERGDENDFIRLKRNMYWMGRSLLDREHRITRMFGELEEAQRQVMDSIDYASAIQHQIQMPPEAMAAYLAGSYILWEPRDIVGGDSYWLHKTPNGVFAGVFDCTGHGVPGAFITLIVHSILDSMDMAAVEGRPGLVLASLNTRLQAFLGQGGEAAVGGKQSNDGLEMSLCYIPDGGDTICHAGAGISAFVNRNGDISVLKAVKAGIGYREVSQGFEYTEQCLPLDGVLAVHMASDGLFDQPGGEKRLPYGKKRFARLLADIQSQPLPTQGEMIWEHFEAYRGKHARRDDITVMGFIPRTPLPKQGNHESAALGVLSVQEAWQEV